MMMKMSTTVQGASLMIERKQKAPGKMAMVVSMNGNVMNETRFDGEKGFVSQMGQKKMIEGEEAEGLKEQAVIFPELNYEDKGYTLELKGVEPVNGEDAYKLIVMDENGDKTTEFYSVETGMKLKEVSTQEGPQGESTVTNEFKDYREVNGIMIPYEMKTIGAMPMPMTMKVEEVQINEGISDDTFKVE
jgi:zinc protease